MVPYAVYVDLECLLTPSDKDDLIKHVPFAVGYYMQCSYDSSLSNSDMYRGENFIELFVQRLYNLAVFHDSQLKHPKPMLLTDEERKSFRDARVCRICKKLLMIKNV